MIILAGIGAIFIFVSIFLFYRAENLARELSSMKKELHNGNKEKEIYLDTLMKTSRIQEQFYCKRVEQLQKLTGGAEQLALLQPLVSNYSAISLECMRQPKKMQQVVKMVCDQQDSYAFKRFESFVTKQDAQSKRLWQKNDLSGLTTLIEAIIYDVQNKINAAQNNNDKVKQAS